MAEPIDHVIEARNLVLGNPRFLTLPLPGTWDIAPGVSRPEINAIHERRSVRWVANGDFWYVVYQRERGWAMEVNGRVRPFRDRKITPSSEVVSVGGHPAHIRWKTRRRGLPWRRHDVQFMTVEFECEPSERRITLEFSGWCPEAGFREVLEALHRLVCH